MKVLYNGVPHLVSEIDEAGHGYGIRSCDLTNPKILWVGKHEVEEYKKEESFNFVVDNINPDHYKIGGIETIDYLKAKLTPEQFKGYCLGNIIKYTSRHQYKNGTEDLEKSQWYMNKLLDSLEG